MKTAEKWELLRNERSIDEDELLFKLEHPQSMAAEENYSQSGQYFLLVLMCPACPQLAHLRVVPVAFSTVGIGVDEGETARSGVGEA
jgi:hypothetical protein